MKTVAAGTKGSTSERAPSPAFFADMPDTLRRLIGACARDSEITEVLREADSRIKAGEARRQVYADAFASLVRIARNMADDTPELVFHGTSFSRSSSILKEGLKPNHYGRYVAVAELLKSAGGFGHVRARRDHDNVAVVFEVVLPQNTLIIPDTFMGHPYAREGKYWQYRDGVIPPSKLKPVAFYRRADDAANWRYYRVQSPSIELELQNLLHRA